MARRWFSIRGVGDYEQELQLLLCPMTRMKMWKPAAMLTAVVDTNDISVCYEL